MKGLEKLEKLSFSNLPSVTSNFFVIDWLTVSFKSDTVMSVIAMLGLDSSLFVEKQSFKNGYPLDTFFGDIHIWSGADDPKYYTAGFNKAGVWITAEMKARNDMGVCLNLSGQGCRCFEEHSKLGWFELIKRILQHNGHVTRLDLAFDDHTGVIDIYRLSYDVYNRNYVSKAKMVFVNWSDDQKTDIQGLTVYIGRRASDVFIRIYDKAAERGYKDRHWVRVEISLKADRSQEAFMQLFRKESIGAVTSGILRNYFSVLEPTSDSNKSRWPIAYYWQCVIGQMERIALWVAPGEPYNFHKTEKHFIEQWAQFLIASKQIYGNTTDIFLLAERFMDGRPLKPKYINSVNEELRKAAARRSSDGCNSEGLVYSNDNFNFLFDDDVGLPFK